MRGNDKLLDVQRRWPRFRWDAQGQSRWAGWGWSQYLVVVAGSSLISAVLLETAIARGGEKAPWPFFGWLAESPSGISILALLLVLNGWLLDRSLADQTPFESTLPPWLRSLRLALVSVPVFGLYAIPAWRWVVQTRPAWARQTSRKHSLDLSSPCTALRNPFRRLRSWIDSRRRTHGQSLPAMLLWMILGQIGPWFALLSGLMTTPSLTPARHAALQGASRFFHLLACVCGIQYGILRGGQTRAGRLQRFVLRWAPLAFLFGFLAWILGMAAWLTVIEEGRETLVGRSWTRKSSSSPQALRVRWASVSPSPFSTTMQNSEILRSRSSFYRLKLLALFFDAAALAWLLDRLGHPLLLWWLVPCLMLAALGLLVEGVLLIIRTFHWMELQDRHSLPYGRWITFPQLVLAVGCLFGSLLAQGAVVPAGGLLFVIGMSAILSTVLFTSGGFLLNFSNQQTFVTLSWMLLFLELLVVGGSMSALPEHATPFLTFFKAAIILTPVWGCALACSLGRALSHPFRPGYTFGPRLPGRFRVALAVVCATAALPLGAIAIPFWIYASHWLWPRYEPLLKGAATS